MEQIKQDKAHISKVTRMVGKAINQYQMIEANEKVLVAVSGGKDSLALLEVLSERRKKLPITYELHAVHRITSYNVCYTKLLRINISFNYQPELKKNETFLNGVSVEDEIRGMEVSQNVSRISAIAFVRKRLVELQQEMGRVGGVVMDGRDIGTVVFPSADLKLFMTTSADIRAQRRFAELRAKGEDVHFDEILEEIGQGNSRNLTFLCTFQLEES